MKLVLWQKVLVHLDRADQGIDDRGEYWPVALTQSSMAETLNKSRGMISLAISELVGAGLITGTMHRVEGGTRTLLCHRLTEAGRVKAAAIVETLERQQVDVDQALQETVNQPRSVKEIWREVHLLREKIDAASRRLENLEAWMKDLEVPQEGVKCQ